jgi:hypothetical protein
VAVRWHRSKRDDDYEASHDPFALHAEVPGAIVIQILGRKMDAAWTEPFLFCRETDARSAAALSAGPPLQLNSSVVPRRRRQPMPRGDATRGAWTEPELAW